MVWPRNRLMSNTAGIVSPMVARADPREMFTVRWSSFWRAALTAFALLPEDQPDGSLVYCSDCARTDPCAAGGIGAFANRLDSAWACD